METPNKIYICPSDLAGIDYDEDWLEVPCGEGCVEYIRTDALEVKESLTWKDIRELYIILAEVDVDIELGKTSNIQAETIGYYQEVLRRFKAKKGE